MVSAVFGFSVVSDLPLRFTRAGAGREVLTVDAAPGESLGHGSVPIFQWKFKDPAGDVSGRLHRADDGRFHFWTADSGWFRVDPVGRRVTVPREAEEPRRELRLWGVPTTLCSVERGDLSLHAAAVEIDGGAVLFAAPGQHGKTTLALAFHTSGFRVLSEDVACCQLDDPPRLFPGPASLRVRPDMFEGSVPEGTTLVAAKPDRIFLRLAPERSGTADPLPIRAIFFLRRSEADIRLERVAPVRSLPDLYSLSFRVPGSDAAARSFERIGRLAARTPIWNLYRPLRRDNLDEVVARIADAPLVTSA